MFGLESPDSENGGCPLFSKKCGFCFTSLGDIDRRGVKGAFTHGHMSALANAHPILTCADAHTLESSILTDESSEWAAMKKAGCGIAVQVVADYSELKAPPQHLRILALIGKGNNGGDALIACGQLLADFPRARVDLLMTHSVDALRPLAVRALQQLEGRVHAHTLSGEEESAQIEALLDKLSDGRGFHICLDGLLGMSFKPPMRTSFSNLVEVVNDYAMIDLRAAVDLPSGKGDGVEQGSYFRADFTYATGTAKEALFRGLSECGRVRYVDLGFFDAPQRATLAADQHVILESVLDPIRRLRPASVDKRAFGHLFIVGGSAYMPGALLMAVRAAVRSGAGLVTAFAPASMAASLAAQVPEAMWIPWPESSNGTLSPRAIPLLMERVGQASAVLVGPGMGKDRNTEIVTQEIVAKVEAPVILDADALRERVMEVVQKRKAHFGRIVLTPHMGEFMRIAKLSGPEYRVGPLVEFCKANRVLTVLKGAHTRICDGQTVLLNLHGGPVLSRGGSGDLLAGLVGGMMAQNNTCVQTAVTRGVILHGLAAERLAQAKGQVAVQTTEVLDYLSDVLRG